MKALVTGASGFIGSHLAEHLIAHGYSVRALVLSDRETDRLAALGVEVVRGDVRDRERVQQAVSGCAHVYHLAGLTARRGGKRALFAAVNASGTENVARAALEAGVSRLIYGSTAGVYGFSNHATIKEQSPLRPNSPYRDTKRDAEAILGSFYQRDGLPVVITRYSSVIGPRSMSWLGLCRAVATTPFRIIGSGENLIPLCPVSDLVEGLRLCAETPNLAGETFLFAGRESTTLNRFLETVAQTLDVSPPAAHVPAFPFRLYHRLALDVYRLTKLQLPRAHMYELFLASRHFDISKARQRLGYQPQVPLHAAIQDMTVWYRSAGYL